KFEDLFAQAQFFVNPSPSRSSSPVKALAIGDFDGDDIPDLLLSRGSSTYLLINQGCVLEDEDEVPLQSVTVPVSVGAGGGSTMDSAVFEFQFPGRKPDHSIVPINS